MECHLCSFFSSLYPASTRTDRSPLGCKPLYTNSLVLMKDFTASSWPKTSQRGSISHVRSAELIPSLQFANPHYALLHEVFQPWLTVLTRLFSWAVLESYWIIWTCLSEGRFWSLLINSAAPISFGDYCLFRALWSTLFWKYFVHLLVLY